MSKTATWLLLMSFIAFFCGFARFAKAEEPSFRVVRKSVVYDGLSCSTPGIIRAQDGDLLVSFQCGVGLYTSRSKDNGMTWEKPQHVAEGANTEIGMTTLRDGTILWPIFQELIKFPGYQFRRYTTYVYRSRDNGLTWEGDEPISTRMREPIPYGHIVELSSGKLLMPVWGAYRLGDRWQVGVFESQDRGKGWMKYTRIAYDPKAGSRPDNGFNETTVAQLPDGTLVAILRQQRVGTQGGPAGVYTEPNDNLYRAISRDSGKTWSRPERLALSVTSPALHVLQDGTLMLGYRDHPQQHEADIDEHYGLGIRISKDQGVTWTNEVHLEDPKGLQYSSKAKPGYPDFVDLPGGDVLVVFYSLDAKRLYDGLYIAANVIHRIQ